MFTSRLGTLDIRVDVAGTNVQFEIFGYICALTEWQMDQSMAIFFFFLLFFFTVYHIWRGNIEALSFLSWLGDPERELSTIWLPPRATARERLPRTPSFPEERVKQGPDGQIKTDRLQMRGLLLLLSWRIPARFIYLFTSVSMTMVQFWHAARPVSEWLIFEVKGKERGEGLQEDGSSQEATVLERWG